MTTVFSSLLTAQRRSQDPICVHLRVDLETLGTLGPDASCEGKICFFVSSVELCRLELPFLFCFFVLHLSIFSQIVCIGHMCCKKTYDAKGQAVCFPPSPPEALARNHHVARIYGGQYPNCLLTSEANLRNLGTTQASLSCVFTKHKKKARRHKPAGLLTTPRSQPA